MRVSKRQLRRIIKEEKTKLLREGDLLPITQGDYDVFVEAIASGYGWIDPDDVERQWEGMFGLKLNPAAAQSKKASAISSSLMILLTCLFVIFIAINPSRTMRPYGAGYIAL